jgi:hypothetical protein
MSVEEKVFSVSGIGRVFGRQIVITRASKNNRR